MPSEFDGSTVDAAVEQLMSANNPNNDTSAIVYEVPDNYDG